MEFKSIVVLFEEKEDHYIFVPMLQTKNKYLSNSDKYILYKKKTINLINTKKECVLLVLINCINQEIVKIIKILDPNKKITDLQFKEVNEFNKKKLSMKNKRTLIEKPEDIYIDNTTWELLCCSLELGEYPLIIGPKGTGKTTLVMGLSKALNYNYYSINCGALFKPKLSLVGSLQAKEGSTYLVEAEFLKHFISKKPTLIFLNELSRTPQMAVNSLMTILDKIQSYIYIEEQGEKVYKGENVTFIADANFGFEYTDTRNIDGAFLDRFLKISVNYLTETEEIDLISKKIPSASEKDIKKIVKKANLCRKEVESLQIPSVSTRQLISLCKFLTKGFTVTEITEFLFKNIFLTGNNSDDLETISKILDSNV